jgi:glycosyltransferase involved in cell wall biosynthesis
MSDVVVVQVCSSDNGGGAEKLVSKLLVDSGKIKNKYGIFFCKPSTQSNTAKSKFFNESPRSFYNIIKLRINLKKIIRQHEGSRLIIHAHLTWPLFFVAVASIGLNATLIYTEHSTYNKRRGYPLFRWFDFLAYSRYSHVVCISDSVSSSLLSWLGPSYANRIQTIKNGSDFYKFIPRRNVAANQKIKLLSIGRLTFSKGFHTIIKSLKYIEEIVESYTIVGSGPEFNKLNDLAVEYGVEHKVHFAGWSSDIERFYHDADILLIPSHIEGFGLVAVEGMSTGLPIVCSNIIGLTEVVPDQLQSSLLVDDFEDPQAWSRSIKVMKNKLESCSTDIFVASREQSEKFSIDEMLSLYEELYVKVGRL